MNGLTFDAGGLIALERNDRRVYSLIDIAVREKDPITVPATALAQVIRNPARQARLSRLLDLDETVVAPLDAADAQAIGLLLAQTRTTDIADAHVVICAQKTGNRVITSDPLDLRRLDPSIRLFTV